MRRVLVLGVALALGACLPPPPSSQEELYARSAGFPLETKGSAVVPGSEAAFGSTLVRIERAEPIPEPRDLVRETFFDLVALASAQGAQVRATAGSAERTAGDATTSSPSAHLATIAARVGHQSQQLADVAGTIRASAEKVAEVAALAQAVGALFSETNERWVLHVAAESHGHPYRATCSTTFHAGTTEHLLEAGARAALSCIVGKAEASPSVVYRLTARSAAVTGHYSGELARRKRGEAEAPIATFERESSPMVRDDGTRGTLFTGPSGKPIANLGLSEPRVWHADDRSDASEALDVAMGVLALVPWPAPPKGAPGP